MFAAKDTYYQNGFTLFEVMVTISIIGILTVMTGRAFPIARNNQSLRLAEQQLQASLREAQQLALYEDRNDDCVARPGDDSLCSDIGVHLAGNVLTMFADIDADGVYSNDTTDFRISTASLPSGVTVTTTPSYLFRGDPPTVELFVNNRPENDRANLTLEAGNITANYEIHSYGQVTRVP